MTVVQKVLSGVALATLMAASGANAGTITQYGYDSVAPGPDSGMDAFGNQWNWDKTIGVLPGPGAGFSAWGTPGLDFGVVTYGGANPSNNFEISFDFFVGGGIDQTPPSGGGGNEETTRLSVDGTLWTAKFDGSKSVEFDAPTGTWITAGDSFFVNVVFDNKLLNGTTAGFSATWSATTVVPETSTWVMMALGFVGLGFAGYRSSRKSVALNA